MNTNQDVCLAKGKININTFNFLAWERTSNNSFTESMNPW